MCYRSSAIAPEPESEPLYPRSLQAHGDTVSQPGQPVFISFRVQEAKAEATALRDKLAAMGVGAFVSEGGVEDAEDWRGSIAAALKAAKVVVVLGTRTYGAAGSSSQGTWEELLYVKKRAGAMRIFVVKMCDAYDEAKAELELDKYQAPHWTPGEPLPERVWQGLMGILQKAGLIGAMGSSQITVGGSSQGANNNIVSVAVLQSQKAAVTLTASEHASVSHAEVSGWYCFFLGISIIF